jgi:hypothetical protein
MVKDVAGQRDLHIDAAAAGSAEGLGRHGVALLFASGDAGETGRHPLAGFHKGTFVHRIARCRISAGIWFRNSVSELPRKAISL